MKINWGWKIVILYSGFVVFMTTLVIASNRQSFDLVSKDYYDKEIGYQKVIDAGKNQSALSAPLSVYADAKAVFIDFPNEFKGKSVSSTVQFYSPVNSDWDRNYIATTQNNSISFSRAALKDTRYIVKITCSVAGESYYQESEIMLHP